MEFTRCVECGEPVRRGTSIVVVTRPVWQGEGYETWMTHDRCWDEAKRFILGPDVRTVSGVLGIEWESLRYAPR